MRQSQSCTPKHTFHSHGVEITRGDRGVIVYGTWVPDAADRILMQELDAGLAEALQVSRVRRLGGVRWLRTRMSHSSLVEDLLIQLLVAG